MIQIVHYLLHLFVLVDHAVLQAPVGMEHVVITQQIIVVLMAAGNANVQMTIFVEYV